MMHAQTTTTTAEAEEPPHGVQTTIATITTILECIYTYIYIYTYI